MKKYLTDRVLGRIYQPTAALIVYTNKRNVTNRGYVEVHKIDNEGRLREGKPITSDALNRLSKAFIRPEDQSPKGLIPRNMLYADPDKRLYVWYTPPGKKTLLFDSHIPLDDGQYMMPGIVYRLHENTLSIWAFDGETPDENTKLLHAPCWHVYEKGNVCMGTATPKKVKSTWRDIVDTWTAAFWAGRNVHTNWWPEKWPLKGRGSKKYIPLDKLVAMYKDRPFDTTKLIPTGYTLNDILSETF